MFTSSVFSRVASKPDLSAGIAIFVFLLLVFLFSRVHQLTDSNYSMLLSQSLLEHRSFALDHYALPRFDPTQQLFHVSVGRLYQLEYVDGHIYYFWPPGTSLLSMPFVALMNALGLSAANPDGTYNPTGEITIQARLAALLMSLLGVLFYLTARLLLPLGWSTLLALSGALATQVWSTASRALWSETWGIFLLGFVILMLVGHEVGRRPIKPIWLASLLAWTYFVRPTFSLPIIVISIYLLLFHRRFVLPYILTGLLWFVGFVVYSWSLYHQPLPNYYLVYRHFSAKTLGIALAGNLISPSRGLFVFVPILIFVGYILIRYMRKVPLKRLAVITFIVIIIHMIVVSSHSPWYGGHCFGPRYSSGLVPWFFLLALLAVAAWRSWHSTEGVNRTSRSRFEAIVGGTLLLITLTINALGATSHATWLWNSRPINVDEQPDRVWDWKHPQFLAKWIRDR